MAITELTITLRADQSLSPDSPSAPACPYCGQVDPDPSTHLARVHPDDES